MRLTRRAERSGEIFFGLVLMARLESRVEVPAAINGGAINDWAVRTEQLPARNGGLTVKIA